MKANFDEALRDPEVAREAHQELVDRDPNTDIGKGKIACVDLIPDR